MSTFLASKFNANTDPSRPILHAIVKHKNKKYSIEKVEAVEGSKLLKMVENAITAAPYDELLIQDHPTRPFVKWLCWVNRVKKVTK